MSEQKPSKPNIHAGAIRLVGPDSMSPEWRQTRDAIQATISDTIGKVEAAKAAGETVLAGFGINVSFLGSTTTKLGSRLKVMATEASAPGLRLGVREGRLQEASRVRRDEDGSLIISHVRMPNFQPGHSPEIGEHAPIGGIAYEAGRIVLFPNGESTSHTVTIDNRGMVKQGGWTGEATVNGMVTDDARLRELEQWTKTVAVEII